MLDLTGHSDLFLNQNNIRKSSYILIKRISLFKNGIVNLKDLTKENSTSFLKIISNKKNVWLPYQYSIFSHYLSFEPWTFFCRFCRNDLLVCKHLGNKRKLLIDKYYYTRSNVLKYKQLLSHENVTILKRLSLFASHIIKIAG